MQGARPTYHIHATTSTAHRPPPIVPAGTTRHSPSCHVLPRLPTTHSSSLNASTAPARYARTSTADRALPTPHLTIILHHLARHSPTTHRAPTRCLLLHRWLLVPHHYYCGPLFSAAACSYHALLSTQLAIATHSLQHAGQLWTVLTSSQLTGHPY